MKQPKHKQTQEQKLSTIEQFYIDHKKKEKHLKSTKCPMANKNCKQWEIEKQICVRGWCGV